MSEPERLKIWTDGSCFPNPGKGGWAWVTECGAHSFGVVPVATNNITEIQAVIEAIKAHPNRPLLIVSDSQYVIMGATEWWKKWESKGWKTANGKKPVMNLALWKELIALVRDADIHFEWVRGHSGDPMNERADELANGAIGVVGNPYARFSKHIRKTDVTASE